MEVEFLMPFASSSPGATLMATDSRQLKVDHLSALSDDLLISILSLLPTHIAARTSARSRRFRHLWKASPSLDLSSRDLPPTCHPYDMVGWTHKSDNFIVHRNPSHTLLHLRLDLLNYFESEQQVGSFITSLLVKAHSCGLRHLTVEHFRDANIEHIFSVIFSIGTLTYLSLDRLPHPQTIQQFDLFSLTTLPRLKTLSFCLYGTDDLTVLDQFLPLFPCLEDLQLSLRCMSNGRLGLSSHTIKKLKLTFFCGHPRLVTLSFPSLKLLRWDSHGKFIYFPQFHGEMPLLKKAVISLAELDGHKHELLVLLVCSLLSHMSKT